VVALTLDWAGGVLFGLLLTLLAVGVVTAALEPGLKRRDVLINATMLVWPLGAIFGTWLAAGRPISGRGLALACALTVVGVGVLTIPFWLRLELYALRLAAGLAVLLLAPIFARLGVGLARKQSQEES
jgi:hypothetical protein